MNEPRRPVKSNRNSGCLGAVLGAVLGGAGGFIAPPVYYQLTNPRVLLDGQWGMVYLLALPVGVILGAIIGGIVAAARK